MTTATEEIEETEAKEQLAKLSLSSDLNNNNNNDSKTQETPEGEQEEEGDLEPEEKDENDGGDELETPSDDQRDPEMEEFARQFRKVYEADFRAHLKRLSPGEPLAATSLPPGAYCKETYETDAMNATTLNFHFEALELDPKSGDIDAVVASTFDRSQRCHFHPHACRKYGPYQGTTLYTALFNVGRKQSDLAEEFFLDLPVELYNLIDE